MVLKVQQGTCSEETLPRVDPDSESLNGSVDTPKFVEFFKPKIHGALINTESIYKYRPHQETDPHPGLSYPEAQTATGKSYNVMILITLQKVMNERIKQAMEWRILKLVMRLVGHFDIAY